MHAHTHIDQRHILISEVEFLLVNGIFICVLLVLDSGKILTLLVDIVHHSWTKKTISKCQDSF